MNITLLKTDCRDFDGPVFVGCRNSDCVWKRLLVLGLVVCVDEAVPVEELRHDVGFEVHVERRASFLALKQVRVVTHLHKNTPQTTCLEK